MQNVSFKKTCVSVPGYLKKSIWFAFSYQNTQSHLWNEPYEHTGTMGYGNLFALQIASHKDNWSILCPEQFLTACQTAPPMPSPWTSRQRFIFFLHSSGVLLISFCLTALCVRGHPFRGPIACLIGLYFLSFLELGPCPDENQWSSMCLYWNRIWNVQLEWWASV